MLRGGRRGVCSVGLPASRETYPEDQPGIPHMPAVAEVVREEAPAVAHVLVAEEDAHAVVRWGVLAVVVVPYQAEEERAGGGHDGDVGREPVVVVDRQGVDDLADEGVVGDGADDIVANARGV